MNDGICIIPVRGIGDVQPGDDLASILVDALTYNNIVLENGDVLVVPEDCF
jgi:coenzyme F420-0 gamma-glutamyl ligase (EC 6.3.2.-)